MKDIYTTPIENVYNEKTPVQKRIIDGQLLIEKNDKTYNALGAEVK